MSKVINQKLAAYRWQIKTLLHLVLLCPLLYCILAVSNAWWGGDPVQAIIHYLANSALNILLVTLCLAPLSRKFKLPGLLAFRRLIGLYVFVYALLHLAAYLVIDLGLDWQLFWQENLQRPYIWLGMVAFLVLLAMSITSVKVLQQKLGRRWLQLHGFIYPITLLVLVHFWWSLKSGWLEPVLYLALVIGLISLRKLQVQRWLGSFSK
ncbi:protein-methionine-sulfoxide reductase heme-binding subunit MsrQ [Agarivorans aestuarii]|uniref:Protein-methionine-sulfoxide reductase heme-binding subunit MsrQ n=1 Tax=Agarivorans aestuarii TaxID=1563703 RepID=A0ABU7FZI7_9ALTE|nr:protein-methionine-sulfoxide reductase heme-binding subunit MsrQ [Agarivorans aestuarii]MEE1672592.1 protein-methionine-sulfoxide reductase heme-binding subunit MsrQ [Agarivorans aestuarii]